MRMNFKERSLLVLAILTLIVGGGIEIGHAGESDQVTKAAQTSTDFRSLLKESRTAYNQKDFALASYLTGRIVYSGDISNKELMVESLYLQGKAFAAQDKYKQAISSFSKVIELTEPGIKQTMAYSYRAEMFEKNGDIDQSIIDREHLKHIL